ncbi:succinate dehydrogenase, hydrophobic membrane anchor protein [Asticcacaulis sp. BYS171W]|uniref:Succinate dehydrogenase hydrophobic membrane anchor subunit n=1 Tax=Asticcacaulis aquaticus TaxID=2984212 RepID=A0ABT5HRB4_9CAUL|nr:succinate dehydrogenase, hydrophobic membrane anchor protein [Asticcacaulis aquaticus]MDC7682616.1 succinate dehydrogenase, hydrophobic membrane anchor protein [Asticcacaulis aquaticus]
MVDSYLRERSSKDWKKSEKHGAGEWLAERWTSVALIVLTGWALWSAYGLMGQGYEAALAFVKAPVNAGLLALTFIITVWHTHMGLTANVLDYFPNSRALKLISALFCLVLLVAALGGIFLAFKA